MNKLLKKELQAFMADSLLGKLCEFQRTSDEVFDVIRLIENQHSDILAWLFDAKEGHGQGDEILRDLLIYASSIVRQGDGCALEKKGETAKFFRKWSPSKLRTTSLGAAFSARELRVEIRERVDLFVIDPQNKFVLIIENKSRSSHTEAQLSNYWELYENLVLSTKGLEKYDRAYIALDKRFEADEDSESPKERPQNNRWLHISYDWLKASAERARRHVERGNAAANLVLSYCSRQTDWEDQRKEDSLQMAFELYNHHPTAVKYLVDTYGKRSALEWFNNPMKQDEYSLFMLQNKGVAEILKECCGIAAFRANVLRNVEDLPEFNVRTRRISLAICPPDYERFANAEGKWPVFFIVRPTDNEEKPYKLILWWRKQNATSEDIANNLRDHLAKGYKKLLQHPMSSRRKLLLADELTEAELMVELRKQLGFIAKLRNVT